MRTILAHFVAAAICLVSAPAWSAALYMTHAESLFAIGTADGVEVNSNTGSKMEIGAASAFHYTDFITGSGVRPVEKSINIGGLASGPETSLASSTRMTGHVIEIDNLDRPGVFTDDIRVHFDFIFLWSVALSADSPAADFASSGAFFGISGFEPGIDAIDIDGDGLGALTDFPGGSAYLFNPTYTTLGGGTGGVGTMSVSGDIIVHANRVGAFSVITDSTGLAFHVPEPGSLLLVGLALLCMSAAPRRAGR